VGTMKTTSKGLRGLLDHINRRVIFMIVTALVVSDAYHKIIGSYPSKFMSAASREWWWGAVNWCMDIVASIVWGSVIILVVMMCSAPLAVWLLPEQNVPGSKDMLSGQQLDLFKMSIHAALFIFAGAIVVGFTPICR
jgi:hypothetical protein